MKIKQVEIVKFIIMSIFSYITISPLIQDSDPKLLRINPFYFDFNKEIINDKESSNTNEFQSDSTLFFPSYAYLQRVNLKTKHSDEIDTIYTIIKGNLTLRDKNLAIKLNNFNMYQSFPKDTVPRKIPPNAPTGLGVFAR